MSLLRREKREAWPEALRAARVAKGDPAIDGRTKEGRMLDRRGFRRVVAYLSPAEFRQLEEVAEEEGASLSVVLRAALRACFPVE